MSQMVTRKGPVGEDKEKRQTDSPVKDMKKKIAANAEKEKQADKVPEKPSSDKNADKLDKSIDKDKKDVKTADKTDKKDPKSADKTDKKDAKPAEKVEKKDVKTAEKTDKKDAKTAEKTDKKDAKTPEKSDKKEKDKSVDKVDKKEKTTDKKDKAPEKSPEKKDKADKKDDAKERNGKASPKPAKQNGTRNGDHDASSEDDELERDELFPELAYDDSDAELVEVVEGVPSRSTTRRDQVKATRTPETPRPASDKRPEQDAESKEKILKLQDISTDRKLRSADSPKPKDGKAEADKHMEIDIVVEVENEEGERRKPDTNYARSRARVSPYRRARDADTDVTACSAVADYTGNNTTMETDIDVSLAESAPDSPYLSGLRTIRGRRSYKPLREMTLRNLAPRPARAAPALPPEPIRPMAPVVGRKRKPDDVEVGVDALADKRPRLLQRLARPFRSLAPARHAEIVGINTDLPMTAPVACTDAFDPEAIKSEDTDTVDHKDQIKDQKDQIPVPTSRLVTQADNKRCAIV